MIFDIYLICLTVGLTEGVENKHLITANQENGSEQKHQTTCHRSHKLSEFTETVTKQTMIAVEEAVLTEALALLPPLLIFRRIP